MKVTITVGAEEGKFEGGTTPGNWRIEAMQGTTVAFEYEGVDPTTSFDMPEGQVYTLRGWRLSSTHEPLGSVASMDYTVGSDLALIWVATSITAKAAPPAPLG